MSYNLQKLRNKNQGDVKVLYNERQVLHGTYNRVEQQKHPIYKETTDISLENEVKPLGIHYVSTRDSSDPAGTQDVKHFEVFELRNTKNFNLTGELHSRTTISAQDFKVVAIHPNRAVVLSTKYEEVSPEVVRQHTKLELSETAWIGYNLELGNFSKVSKLYENLIEIGTYFINLTHLQRLATSPRALHWISFIQSAICPPRASTT